MTFQHRHTSGRRGSIMLYFTLALPFMILPLAGLAIEGTVARIVQTKLQAAVDGASLGAGRLLGTNANMTEIAGEFLKANFQTSGVGFFRANNLTYTATYTPGVVKTVAVSATVQVPATLGRLLGTTNYTIAATATATRKDTRVIMVLDRSGSMTALQPTLKTLAQGFAQKFSGSTTIGGADELGLVAFDGSAVVGYPTNWPWDSTITATSTGGPDSLFNDGTSDNMISQIGTLHSAGFTNTSEALWLAYHELQKAHLRDLAAPGSGGIDQRLNAVLLFTDGVPTAVTIYPNNPADPNSPATNAIKTTSSCKNKAVAAPVPASKQITGWISAAADGSTGGTQSGMYPLAYTNSSHTLAWWLTDNNSSSAQDQTEPSSWTASGGPADSCNGLTGSNFQSSSTSDLNKIPSIDAYGDALNTNAYTYSHFQSGSYTSIWNGTNLDQTKTANGYHWGLAIFDSADSAAYNMRTDSNFANRTGDTQKMPVTIHVIAYTGNTGVDDGLLKRMANTADSTSFSTAQPQGLYVPAGDSTALANAFNQVASSLLHLTH